MTFPTLPKHPSPQFVSQQSRQPSLNSIAPPQSPTQFTPPHTPKLEPDYIYTPSHTPKSDSLHRSSTTKQSAVNPISLPPRTKIICTIGPKSQSIDVLKKLIFAGMNVARLNFSHGTHEFHKQTINNIRSVMSETRRICAIMLDTKGPEIRTGLHVDHGEINLVKGAMIEFHCNNDKLLGSQQSISIQYPNLCNVIEINSHILIDDGLFDFCVHSIDKDKYVIQCEILNSGMLGEQKGVNLPGINVDLPAVTQKDVSDINFAINENLDFIAASFIRKRADLLTIRKILGDRGKSIQIISKIENQQGLDNFDEILSESDGIMIARGDLGVEIPIENVSIAQKMIIHKCNSAGKYVITATQMLESMIKNPSPTRAEASDIANAVLDGTDCVMLSGETAKGLYPIESVQIMSDICKEAETNINYLATFNTIQNYVNGYTVPIVEAIAISAVRATFDINASLIIVLTETGHTARLVAKYRPRSPIVTVTSNEQTARQSLIVRGLFPLLVSSMVGSESLTDRVLTAAQRLQMCGVGDKVVVTQGIREAKSGTTNEMKIVTIS